MKLTNFDIDNDNIALNYNGNYFDLHNSFDFRDFHYDITSQQLELKWTRSHEDWSKETICGFKLIFRSVNFFKLRERDPSVSPKEDNCLSIIGFVSQDLRDEFDSYTTLQYVTENDDLNIAFESGIALKINCTYVDLCLIEEEVVYVLITNEPVQVWRPMWADKIENNIYKIKSFSSYDATDEELQFKTGDIVICEKQKKSEGQVLVAIKLR
jgi:hypothetical protein